MYRPGIWCKKRLLSSPEQILGFRIAVAYGLLDVSGAFTPEDLAVFERTTRAVKLSSAVYRTTYHSRFSDLDLVIQRIFWTVFPGKQSIDVQDWAGSTAVPAVEWARRIFADF